jgi:hypothetical protein
LASNQGNSRAFNGFSASAKPEGLDEKQPELRKTVWLGFLKSFLNWATRAIFVEN